MASWVWIWILVVAVWFARHGALGTYVCGKGVTTKTYSQCKLLPSLDASLAWTLDKSTNSIDFAFTEDFQSSNGWVAWGINPTGLQMSGTQALVAFRNTTGGVLVRTYDVTAAVKLLQQTLVPGPVTVDYSNYSASATAAGTCTISGTVKLMAGQSTALNLVWNRGPVVVAVTSALSSHPLDSNNLASYANVEMSTGQQTAGGEVRNKDLKDIHGVLNAVSWGILLPLGLMVARYLRPFDVFDPAWFYLHVGCQLFGYAGGTAGWIIGLKLQQVASPIKYKHRNLGIAIWALATFQILGAILLRPKKNHEGRRYWDIMHHTIGYVVVILAIINIFEGIDLLGEDKWKRIYIIILVALAIVSVVLELITWFHWLGKRSRRKHPKHSQLIVE